jgi:hypothetical protein
MSEARIMLFLKEPVEAASGLASFDPKTLGANRWGAFALAGGALWIFKPASTATAGASCIVPAITAASAAYQADPTTAPGRWEPATATASSTILADLASTATGKGAALVGIFDTAGRYTATTVEGALIEAATLAELASTALNKGATFIAIRDAGNYTSTTNVEAAIQELYSQIGTGTGRSKKRLTLAFNNAALTATSAGANGDAATVSVDTALPNNARIIGVDMHTLTPFTGGGVTTVTGHVGTSGDIDALAKNADLLTAAVDGGPSAMALGIRPNKFFASGGQLILTIAPDGSHKLSDLTAGSVIIDVLYEVLP